MPSPEVVLLTELLKKRDEYVSGNDMAEMLGVSRVSVWSYFEKMREDGFQFSAVRNRGYRLEKEPDRVHPALLQAYLNRRRCPAQIFCFPEVESTNIEAHRQLLAGQIGPIFITANRQTGGRGRMGRVWNSEEEGNLYMTMAFRPHIASTRIMGYTLWMGLQLCRFMAEQYDLPFKVKWPNDILCNGKKIGGILTEVHLGAETVHGIALGLGFNINGNFKSASAQVQNVAGSLYTLTRRKHRINEVTADIIECLMRSNEIFLSDDMWRIRLHEQWPQYDALAGQPVLVRELDGDTRQATALEISELGGLRIRYDNGAEDVVQAGDVTLAGTPLPE